MSEEEQLRALLRKQYLGETESIDETKSENIDTVSTNVDSSDDKLRELLRKQYPVEPTVETSVEQDFTFLDKVKEARQLRSESVGQTISDYAVSRELEKASPLRDSMFLENNRTTLPLTGATTQILGDTVGFAGDIISAGITESTENVVELLPEAFKASVSEGAKKLATKVVNTGPGRFVLEAFGMGGRALEIAKEKYPQEYKTLAGTINTALWQNQLVPNTGKLVKSSGLENNLWEYTKPSSKKSSGISLKNVGQRNVLKPVRGRDQDVFSVIEDTSKEAQLKAVDNTTSKPGILGKQERLLTPEERALVDEAKLISGLKSTSTMQHNFNLVRDKGEALKKNIKAKLKKNNISVDIENVKSKITEKLNTLQSRNAELFNVKQLKNLEMFEHLAAKVLADLDRYGHTAAGAHKARVNLDSSFQSLKQVDEKFKDADKEAINAAYTQLRLALNETVDEAIPDVAPLRAQYSRLITIKENIRPKVVGEQSGPLGRLFQRWGVGGETQTFAGKAANILLKGPAMVASPFLMAGSKFKDLAKNAPVQTVKGKTIYIMRDVIQEAKRGASKIKDPQELRRLNADIKIVQSLLNNLESGKEDEYYNEVEEEVTEPTKQTVKTPTKRTQQPGMTAPFTLTNQSVSF